jgi:chromosome segregation ATPase
MLKSVCENSRAWRDDFMASDLTRRLDRLSTEMRRKEEIQKTEDHKRLLDLTLLVLELSQKLDKLEVDRGH